MAEMVDAMDSGDEEMMDEAPALRQDLTCPVCKEVFRNPSLLPCTHSLCGQCLQASMQFSRTCPVCRTKFKKEQVIFNRVLSHACETFLRESGWQQPRPRDTSACCSLHLKPLGLYCEKDEVPLCDDCVSLHNTHKLWSLADGVSICKKELDFKVQIFENKVISYKKMTEKFNDTIEYIRGQAGHAEQQIRAEFARLHNELDAEEARRLKDLALEEEVKIAAMQELISKTKRDIGDVRELIDSLKREMGNEDVALLQNFQNVKRNTQWMAEDRGFPDNSLLDMGKHVGALGFKIWTSLQKHVKYNPVVFDPNTASPWLSLSPDLSSVKESPELLSVPDTPERFSPCVFILGAEGYTSGKHRWDVVVGDNPKWMVGVCKESVIRKKKFTVSTSRGVWSISLSKGSYTALTPERTVLQVEEPPDRIRVKLNMDKGEVSFWDAGTAKHLVTLTSTFDEKIFPIFGPGLNSTPLTLPPGKMVVHTP